MSKSLGSVVHDGGFRFHQLIQQALPLCIHQGDTSDLIPFGSQALSGRSRGSG